MYECLELSSIYPSIHPSFHPSIPFICTLICTCIYQFIYLFNIHPFIYTSLSYPTQLKRTLTFLVPSDCVVYLLITLLTFSSLVISRCSILIAIETKIKMIIHNIKCYTFKIHFFEIGTVIKEVITATRVLNVYSSIPVLRYLELSTASKSIQIIASLFCGRIS